tara:strand:+ start:1 stop:1056 length:1056 start_codon:yes stop_codon:yes gene_type:complete
MAYTDIDDPSVHFQTALYTGNATQRDITNDGNSDLQPDWVWIKCRSAVESHMLYDSNRGVTKDLRSDGNNAENTNAQGLQTFNSDGFQLGTLQNVNFNTKTMVAWQWKCNGGTTETAVDESGNNPANVRQTNTTAGFSIITYTGTGAAGTIAHGLGAAPDLIINKKRSATGDWDIYYGDNTDYLALNANSGTADNADRWNDTSPTSSVFTLGSGANSNQDGATFVSYCFRSIQGYSKIGSYTGNGNANGTFVYTGFEPAWIMVKLSSANGNSWQIVDNKRNPINTGNGKRLFPNNTNAEASSDSEGFDFLSNGFKLRNASGGGNTNAATYIFMAFAEHPFVSSEGVPTTAR